MKNNKIIIRKPTVSELTVGGFTNRIKVKKGVTSEKLLGYGFRKTTVPSLYFCKSLQHDITFNMSIDPRTLEITQIIVIDEEFLQPYDYQHPILSENYMDFHEYVYHEVNTILQDMQSSGLIEGFEVGMYI